MRPLAIALVTLLAAQPAVASAQLFRRPFACDTCITNFFYFDQGMGAEIRDWNCDLSSYDGHRGTDFSLRGGNPAIDAGYDVLAAADGTVESVQDGHFDRCTACSGSGCGLAFGFGFGNHVIVHHGRYTVVYAHLRTGSVRVRPGDRVTCGQTLGQIGSSGCSTGAHLHFETRPERGGFLTAFDPFEGACTSRSPSLFVDQGPHRGIPSPICDGAPSCPGGVCPPAPDRDGDGSHADTDCDDANASIHPGARDGCGDGIDQDCAGGDAVCPGEAGPAADAGSIVSEGDGQVRTLDASLRGLDAGASSRDRALDGGCACRASPRRTPPVALALGILAAALTCRRRARR